MISGAERKCEIIRCLSIPCVKTERRKAEETCPVIIISRDRYTIIISSLSIIFSQKKKNDIIRAEVFALPENTGRTLECAHAAIRSARVRTFERKDRLLRLLEENDCCRSVKISEDRKRRRFVDVSFFSADAPHRQRRERPIDYQNAFSK